LADAPQLQQLADELEIRNLVSTLAHMADMAPEDKLDGYVALFTDDARWEMPGSLRQGRDDILAGALDRRENGIQGPGTNTRHVITPHAIHVHVDGDAATGNAYFMLVADTLSAPQVRGIGHYQDRYRRTAEGWKLDQRTITIG
jgi:3-phenylpropionate/cinnamic acid dioxygenase small subunit